MHEKKEKLHYFVIETSTYDLLETMTAYQGFKIFSYINYIIIIT